MAASTHLYLHKTDNLLTMAELRNNGTISFDPAELLYAEQVYASEQIEIESNKEEPNSNLLDMSQSYYDAENYYFALMLITEANVSVDAPNSEFDDIAVAEQRLNLTKKVLSSIREEGDIDAPLVQLKVELAVLRLEDAKKERAVVPSLLISSVIQEVTIANEQLDVLQDLKKNIGNIPHEEIILQEEASTDTMFTPVGLFPLIGLVVAYLVRRN